LRRRRFACVSGVEVGDETNVGPGGVRATYAEHDGRRPPLGGPARALGYVITGSECAYFARDTDLLSGMSTLAQEPDVALLPIAGWGARLPHGHLDPERAVSALALLRPRA